MNQDKLSPEELQLFRAFIRTTLPAASDATKEATTKPPKEAPTKTLTLTLRGLEKWQKKNLTLAVNRIFGFEKVLDKRVVKVSVPHTYQKVKEHFGQQEDTEHFLSEIFSSIAGELKLDSNTTEKLVVKQISTIRGNSKNYYTQKDGGIETMTCSLEEYAAHIRSNFKNWSMKFDRMKIVKLEKENGETKPLKLEPVTMEPHSAEEEPEIRRLMVKQTTNKSPQCSKMGCGKEKSGVRFFLEKPPDASASFKNEYYCPTHFPQNWNFPSKLSELQGYKKLSTASKILVQESVKKRAEGVNPEEEEERDDPLLKKQRDRIKCLKQFEENKQPAKKKQRTK